MVISRTRNGRPTRMALPSSATSTAGIETSSDARRTPSALSRLPFPLIRMARPELATTPNIRSTSRALTETRWIGTQRTPLIRCKTPTLTCMIASSGTHQRNSSGLIPNQLRSLINPCAFTSHMLAWLRSSVACQVIKTSPITTSTASRRPATT